MRLLLVDDDAGLRALLRTTFEAVDVEVDEAADATAARERIAVARPGRDRARRQHARAWTAPRFCAQLKAARATRDIPVVLLTGSDRRTRRRRSRSARTRSCCKPFSPLELLAIVERLAGGLHAMPFRASGKRKPTGAAAALRARPAPPARARARAAAPARRTPTTRRSPRSQARSSRRTRARASTRSGSTATRSSSRRPRARSSSRTRASSTASCSTTSARSGSRTRSCRSRGRSPSPSAG